MAVARHEDELFLQLWENICLENKSSFKTFRSYREIAQLMVTFASIAQPMVLLLLTLFFVSHMTVCVFFVCRRNCVDIKATTKHENAKSIFKIFHLFITIPFKTFFVVHAQPKWVCLKQTGDFQVTPTAQQLWGKNIM